MENLLRKRLALIKERARQMHSGEEPPAGATPDIRHEKPCKLEDAASGNPHAVNREPFYLIRYEDESIAHDVPRVMAQYSRIPERETWPISSLIYDPGPAMAKRIAADQICFLDIETTGLTPSTYVFLCGLMFVENGRLVVEQLLARDYSEEVGILLYLRDQLKRHPMLVTYNGAGFDIPFVQTRMAVARIDNLRPAEHVDLLEPAQRHFKKLLPNCRLETIERHLRGVPRTGDIPGRDIPDAYHNFVRTGDARAMKRILYHNRMDLLAMVYLVNHLAAVS